MKGKEIIESSTMSHCLGEKFLPFNYNIRCLKVYMEGGGSLEEVVTWTNC
jgi:hypothetical protein